ncbi:hypothetical protein RRSWK_05432 [Rhodopirellula sp. SWK7]|nr:hypothetical protein RRSWK_05432 [Rhodopirellula sp. SWK7]
MAESFQQKTLLCEGLMLQSLQDSHDFWIAQRPVSQKQGRIAKFSAWCGEMLLVAAGKDRSPLCSGVSFSRARSLPSAGWCAGQRTLSTGGGLVSLVGVATPGERSLGNFYHSDVVRSAV